MSANIEEINGVASFVENGGKEKKHIAWHKLGQVFDRPMFIDEALKLSHANYDVVSQPIAALSPQIMEKLQNSENINSDELLSLIIKDKKANLRTDLNKPLGIVSDSYGIVQNSDAFKFIDKICTGLDGQRKDTPVIETAGVLGNGEKVFVTAKFPNDIILNNNQNDRVNMYMVFTTSHDGTGCVNAMVTPIRVVCNNTLNFALTHNSGKISLRHTKFINNRINLENEQNREFAYKALHLYDVYENDLKANFEHLANVKMSENELNNIIASISLNDDALAIFKQTKNINTDGINTRGKNLYNGLRDSIESGVGQEFGEKGTALWMMNGITSYYQNVNKQADDTKKMDSILNGSIKEKVNEALLMIS